MHGQPHISHTPLKGINEFPSHFTRFLNDLDEIRFGRHALPLSSCEIDQNLCNESHTSLTGVVQKHCLQLITNFWGSWKAILFLWATVKLHFHVYREIVSHFESEKLPCVVCTHVVRGTSGCNFLFIYVLMKKCILKTARLTSDIESGKYFSLQLFRAVEFW